MLDSTKSFNDAQEDCRTRDALLLYFTSMEMYNNMKNEIGSQIYGTRYWIGMRDNNDTIEGLIWDHNNVPVILEETETLDLWFGREKLVSWLNCTYF